MIALNEPLMQSEEYAKIKKDMKANRYPVLITGCIDVQKSQLVETLGRDKQFRLIVTYSDIRARELYESCRFYDKNTYLYPSKDVLFYSADIHGQEINRQRIRIIRRFFEQQSSTIIVTLDALMDRLCELEDWEQYIIQIRMDSVINLVQLQEQLVDLGYEKQYQVERPGEFSIRGGIVDVFPLTEDTPVRIELWDEEIDSIRYFDVDSQCSIEDLDEIVIFPASEMVLTRERIAKGLERLEKEHKQQATMLKETFHTEEYARLNREVARIKEELQEFHSSLGVDSLISYFYDKTVSFLDYFTTEDAVIFVDEINRVVEHGKGYEAEFSESMKSRLEGGYILPTQAKVLFSYQEILAKLMRQPLMLLNALLQKTSGITPVSSYHIEVKSVPSYHNHFPDLIRDLKEWKKKKYRVLIFSPTESRAQQLAENIRYNEVSAIYRSNLSESVEAGQVVVVVGGLPKGFELPDQQQVVIAENDIFSKREKKQRKAKAKARSGGSRINSFSDITVGDYVIHESHGLGIYRGIEKIDIDGNTKDYISIEYQNGSKLYIPATGLDLIQKYASSEGKVPKLNKLGGTEWTKTKSRVKARVNDIAKELVDLYATRQMSEGYVYGPDTTWQKEFEELFPYEETYDQLQAIQETKRDMESKKSMDRLICGDVGFGKTEVAIRAAFKAVTEGKQVVYLVPTTILAQQHYNTFSERMKDYPISVEMLSRFRTAGQQKKTIEGLKKGQVDIVIGTHRLLSKEVAYKDLGLLIIDEEQRFGVSHKEKIKELKKNIDVLSLSATPIPRTLHMSLIGIRDMSLLEEAPVDRRAIQTYVLEYNEELIREAIMREVGRNGQVYYVYNRVNTIVDMTNRIAALVPEVRVAYAHGQMNERELEDIMIQFINHEIDVLVSTTIIETGLDISNVNTMMIHDADKLGLSQLYQLRGRVGRSNRTAYAFFMYRRNEMLTETAEKRLQAIREFTDLGSGYKIAMRDLEIRGAGNLLGSKQSGHMEAVGYDLYCKMLNDAVARLKGEKVEEDFETSIDITVDAYIPNTYVRNEVQKLELYKRIASIETLEEMEDMQLELIDRFGEMPKPVVNLLLIALMKAKAHHAGITEVTQKGDGIQFLIEPHTPIQTEKIDGLLRKYPNQLKLNKSGKPGFLLDVRQIDKKQRLNCVDSVIDGINELIES
ncbi:MAG: transcription-repair coupling factor [Lachnospiraceae bacterium]